MLHVGSDVSMAHVNLGERCPLIGAHMQPRVEVDPTLSQKTCESELQSVVTAQRMQFRSQDTIELDSEFLKPVVVAPSPHWPEPESNGREERSYLAIRRAMEALPLPEGIKFGENVQVGVANIKRPYELPPEGGGLKSRWVKIQEVPILRTLEDKGLSEPFVEIATSGKATMRLGLHVFLEQGSKAIVSQVLSKARKWDDAARPMPDRAGVGVSLKSGPRKKPEEIIADYLLSALEKGVAPWRRPWVSVGCPQNGVSKRPYHGINDLLLGFEAFMKGYEDPRWLTRNQIQQAGGEIKKGEMAMPVVFWKQVQVPNAKAHDEDGRRVESQPLMKSIPFMRLSRVWNVTQTTVALKPLIKQTLQPIESAQRVVEHYLSHGGPQLNHGGDRAAYAPHLDRVVMPVMGAFKDLERYYATLFHELVHSSGHPKRLARLDLNKPLAPFGTLDYSQEELVAELGSTFLLNRAGIDPQLDVSASYCKGWFDVLGKDPKVILQAASQGQKAASLIWPEKTGEGLDITVETSADRSEEIVEPRIKTETKPIPHAVESDDFGDDWRVFPSRAEAEQFVHDESLVVAKRYYCEGGDKGVYGSYKGAPLETIAQEIRDRNVDAIVPSPLPAVRITEHDDGNRHLQSLVHELTIESIAWHFAEATHREVHDPDHITYYRPLNDNPGQYAINMVLFGKVDPNAWLVRRGMTSGAGFVPGPDAEIPTAPVAE